MTPWLSSHVFLLTISMIVTAWNYASSFTLLSSSSSSSRQQQQQQQLCLNHQFQFSLLAVPDRYQERGESIIRNVGRQFGANDLRLEWKPGKLKVIILGPAYLSTSIHDEDDDDDDDDNDNNNNNNNDDDEIQMNSDNLDIMVDNQELNLYQDTYDEEVSTIPVDDDDDDVDFRSNDDNKRNILETVVPSTGVDIAMLARAINGALLANCSSNDDHDDDDSNDNQHHDEDVGTWIAETHEIEVTTPGAPNELSGIMWEVYRGFDVLCDHMDPKTKVQKTIEGKLKERTDEFTILNIRGKIRKLPNRNLVSVRLPKAKRETG
jgi:hypothetical protein